MNKKDQRNKTCGCGASVECDCGFLCSCCAPDFCKLKLCPFCNKEINCGYSLLYMMGNENTKKTEHKLKNGETYTMYELKRKV